MNAGQLETEAELKKLEKKLKKVYSQASSEVQDKLDNYLKQFKAEEKVYLQKLNDGDITKTEYSKWYSNKVMNAERWEAMRDTLAEDLTNVNVIANDMVRGSMLNTFAINHNYGTYEVENGLSINTSYTLYDADTVANLIQNDPELLKRPTLDKNLDLRWNKKLFQSHITQGILQGESIDNLAKRVALGATQQDMNAAIRNARTSTTCAQNAGRTRSYQRAVNIGIELYQVWLAALDSRTRSSHRHMDGEKVKVVKGKQVKFSNGLRYPADPDGRAEEVWNCRCTLVTSFDENEDFSDIKERANKLDGQEYDEWKNKHGRTVPTKGMGDEYTGLDDNNKPVIPKFNNYMFKNHPEAFGDVDALKRRIQENYRRKFNSQIYMIENDPDAIALGYKYCDIDEYLNADFRKQLYLVPRFEDYYKHALAEYGHEYADSGSIMNSLFRYNIGATPDGYGKGKGARAIFDKETGLSDFIDNNPDVHYNGGTLYRGLMTNGKGIKDLEKAMVNGEPLSMRGVSSWSTNQNIAVDFSKNSLRKSKNPVIFEDVTEGARNAMPFPYSSRGFTPQYEVIYSGSAEFDILEIRKENNATYVRVKQRKKR